MNLKRGDYWTTLSAALKESKEVKEAGSTVMLFQSRHVLGKKEEAYVLVLQ